MQASYALIDFIEQVVVKALRDGGDHDIAAALQERVNAAREELDHGPQQKGQR